MPACTGMDCLNHWIPARAGMTKWPDSGLRRAATDSPGRLVQSRLCHPHPAGVPHKPQQGIRRPRDKRFLGALK